MLVVLELTDSSDWVPVVCNSTTEKYFLTSNLNLLLYNFIVSSSFTFIYSLSTSYIGLPCWMLQRIFPLWLTADSHQEAMSQEMRQAKVKRTTNNNLNPLSTCVDPPIPLIPPIEHTVTYRVNSVEHFHQVISEVCNAMEIRLVVGYNVGQKSVNLLQNVDGLSKSHTAIYTISQKSPELYF